jgi:hypothetical protein
VTLLATPPAWVDFCRVLVRQKRNNVKQISVIIAKKSFFARSELEHLGCWVTRKGIQPRPKKVDAMMRLEEPKTRKQLRGFIGMINCHRDTWKHRSHVLAPLTSLTSVNESFACC